MANLTIYSASAGSGKTYTLTLEYLTLALATDSPQGFKHILALTFTNAAASEMKKRLVGALRALAAGESDLLPKLADQLAEAGAFRGLGLSTPAEQQTETRRRAEAMFRQVLYDYADFAVGTIDSFGQRIVQSFARELGLPPAFEVELDTDTVLATAVGLLLDQINRPGPDADPALTALLREYADEAGREGKSLWGLAERVAEFSGALFNDTHLDVVRLLTTPATTLAQHQQWRTQIRAYLADIEAQVEALGQQALALIADAGLTEKHLAGGANGVFSQFRNALRKFQAGEEPTTTARKAVDNDAWHSAAGNVAPYRDRLNGIKDELRSLFDQLEDLRLRHGGGYLLLKAMEPHALSVALLGQVQKLVEDLSRERGVVLIGEFNRRIAGVVLREPVPFVYEKLGERYQHLLLDEFQDTSALQWHNLLPLIENSLGNNQRSLAVGDAKQAIYRWRGGELEQIVALYKEEPERLLAKVTDEATRDLLAQRYESLTGRLLSETLRENWRSRPEIVGFNNQLFTYWATRFGDQNSLLTDLYDDDFAQRTPPSRQVGPAGHVELIFAAKEAQALTYDVVAGQYRPTDALPGYQPEEVLDYNETQLQLMLAVLEQVRADGFALGDVAVLCRTRAQSRAVAKQLKERGYPISSADSLALSFADAVNLLVQLLRVLHQPADGAARAAALLLLDKLVTRRPPNPDRLRAVAELSQAERPARPFWEEINRQAAPATAFDPLTAGNLGLYELTEQLISALDLLRHAPTETEYLFGFLDLTLDYSLRHGNNVGGFLDFWELTGRNQPISTPAAGRDAVTIQTVHKSKGLDYGVVIVPFADWPLRPRAGSRLWSRLPADATLPIADLPPAVVVTQSEKLANTVLEAPYHDEQTRTFVEVVNLLYVAFTRPRHRLYIITKQSEKAAEAGKLPTTADGLLRDFAEAKGWVPGEQRWLFSAGDSAPAPTASEAATDADLPFALTNFAAVPWNARLQLKRHATTLFDFDTQDELLEQFKLLQQALRRLDTPADLPKVLHQLQLDGVVGPGEARTRLERQLNDVLSRKELASAFAPASVVVNALLLPTTAALPLPSAYQPDRIVLDPATNTVTLLDFHLPPVEPRHQEELRTYAAHFRQLGYQTRAVAYYLITGEVTIA